VSRQKKIVKEIVGRHGGILVGKGPGVLNDQKKFDTPYIRDFLLDRGAIADVSDTAAPWSKLMPLYTNVMAAAGKAFAQVGVTGWIMRHLSHSYYSGACLYFTFGFKHDGVDPLGQYERVKNAIQQAFVDSGGTLSHHHAVGTEHAAWLEQDISAPGIHMIDGLLTSMDPGRNFNPGKIIAK
jgi:alkyldihydroxyacetonephosphate synthase